MIVRCSVGLCILFNLILLCQGRGKDGLGFGYQESEEEDPNRQNVLHKRPVAFPSRCKEGELLYPGDQGDDWVCDCKPGYIYYPLNRRCYAAYTRGPCAIYEYLVLPPASVIPRCERNRCIHDNLVFFHDGCYELGKPGPCPVPEFSNVIGVNETTLRIICTKGFTKEEILNTRGGFNEGSNSTETPTSDATTTNVEQDSYDKKECFIGGIRWTSATCPQQNLEKNVGSIFSIPLY